MKAGVTLNPSTPVCMLEDIICDVDMALLMGVNPGFGGQKFIENTINKVKTLRQLIDSKGSKALIQVDGGVQADTAPRLVEAGADVLVSGSYVFKASDPVATIHALSEAAQPLRQCGSGELQCHAVGLCHTAQIEDGIAHTAEGGVYAHTCSVGNLLERVADNSA